MAYRQSTVDEGKIARLQKEGRGLGRGAEYKPWLMIYDLPSKGRSHRVFGTKTRRIHHFLSDIECRLFLHLDWCDEVADIREQFPLDRLVTRQIATSMGVRHPTDTANKTPLVMTTDFLVDVLQEGKLRQEACAVKPSADLKKRRVLEKLEICQRRIKTRPAWRRKSRPLDCDVTDMRTAPAGAVLISAACLAVGISCR
ncbi:TnsA endonuclease N-terminal domain-containing protein [Acidiphilium multivorum]|uniref:TnsA endonuclease N-terminal domain-containing protein n=1 Tax=Acidiphilium multivorum TaxID=62140 RepID=UPI001F4C2F4A|nr:TnsA endonuclease N-terminal domain-containing protein [Acidiphilium multivorum]